jgi:hypothetical protein
MAGGAFGVCPPGLLFAVRRLLVAVDAGYARPVAARRL